MFYNLSTGLIHCKLVFPVNAVPNGVNGINGHVNGIDAHVNGVNGHVNGVNGHAEPGSQPKPSLRLSFTEYRRISNLLVLHLRKAEEGKMSPFIPKYSSFLLPVCFFFDHSNIFH